MKTINGKKCKSKLLDFGEKLTQAGTRPLELHVAQQLWESAQDGNKVTETEKNSMRHMITTYGVTKDAKAFFEFWMEEKEVAKCKGAGLEVVNEVKCDKAMVKVADIFTKRNASRPLSLRAAEGLWFCALDGYGVTKTEKDTLGVMYRKYKWDNGADAFLKSKLGWLDIAQSVAEAPAPGERVTVSPDTIVLRTRDALALASLPAPPRVTVNPLLPSADAQGNSSPPRSIAQSVAEAPALGDRVTVSPDAHPASRRVVSQANALSDRPENAGRSTLKPESFQVAKNQSSKRKSQEEAEQPTLAPKRQKQSDDHAIKLQDLRKIFEKCDKNNDGFVGRIEMIKACRNNPELAKFFGLSTIIRQEDGSKTKQELLFQEIDNDSNNKISWAELLAYYKDRVVDM